MPLVSPAMPVIRTCIQNYLRGMSKACQKWTGFDEISRKLDAWQDTAFDRACDAHAYDSNDFLVLCHGDLWINNIMYKYDGNGSPIDVIIVCIYVFFFEKILSHSQLFAD